MPARITLTAEQEAVIRVMRRKGCSWRAVSRAIGVSEQMAWKLGRRLGLPASYSCIKVRTGRPRAQPLALDGASDDRAPLPSGHAETWGAITCGSILEGAPCRRPV